MSNRRFTCRFTRWLAASAFLLTLQGAQADTPKTDAPKADKTTKLAKADKPMKEHSKRMQGLPKKLQEAIETKNGKPLTDDQKSKINEATDTKNAAVKAAMDKYNSDIAGIVGLTVEDLQAMMKPARKEKGAPAPAPAAPAPAPAPVQ